MTDEITHLEAHRGKKLGAEEQANLYKSRTVKILGDLMDLLREAEKEDYRIEFAIQRDSLGVPYFIGPTIVKRFP